MRDEASTQHGCSRDDHAGAGTPSGSTFPDAPLPLGEDAVQQFLDFVTSSSEAEAPRDGTIVRTLRHLIRGRARGRVRSVATAVQRPLAAYKVRQLARTSPVKLHLGSGGVYKDGWVNIDLVPAKVDIPWNLARGIPFPDASVDAIFHEHLQEHLTIRQGYELARECRRVLRKGGVLRIGVPDAGQVVQSYAGNWDADWARSAPTGMIAIQRLSYENGHRSMYDGQTMCLLLVAAGFSDVQRWPFHEGRLQPNPDTPERAAGTLYVEAVKD
jgi:predicted SAM-dependent methyltransferase